MCRSPMKAGDKYNNWTVLEVIDKNTPKSRGVYLNCLAMCSCGNIKSIARSSLVHGKSKFCKICSAKYLGKKRLKFKSGDKFGEWTILEPVDYTFQNKNGDYVKCVAQCSCGTIKQVQRSALKNGKSTKCGSCATRESGRLKTLYKEGQQIGDSAIIKLYDDKKPEKMVCKCKCGKIYKIRRWNSKKYKNILCKKCRDIKQSGNNSLTWRGYGEISGSIWNKVLQGSRDRNLKVEISIKEAWELFLKQNRRCALTGIKIFFGKSQKHSTTASLDRKNSKLGYISGNIQWVHKKVNIIKWNLPENQFIKYCELIYKHSLKDK